MPVFIERDFGGAERRFRLGIGELRELQDLTGVGPATVLARLVTGQDGGRSRPSAEDYQGGEQSAEYKIDLHDFAVLRTVGGDWRVADLREPIRLGLIGAGATPTDATVLMARYFDQNHKYPIVDYLPLAADIVMHALMPEADDPLGKPEAETAAAQATS